MKLRFQKPGHLVKYHEIPETEYETCKTITNYQITPNLELTPTPHDPNVEEPEIIQLDGAHDVADIDDAHREKWAQIMQVGN